MYRQTPTPVGRRGQAWRERDSTSRAKDPTSWPAGRALVSRKRGREQIVALFENGGTGGSSAAGWAAGWGVAAAAWGRGRGRIGALFESGVPVAISAAE